MKRRVLLALGLWRRPTRAASPADLSPEAVNGFITAFNEFIHHANTTGGWDARLYRRAVEAFERIAPCGGRR